MILGILAASAPDALVMIRSIAGAMEYFFSFLRLFMIVAAFVWMFMSLMNLYSVTSSNGGQVAKMLPSNSQPTHMGAWLQFVTSGLVLLTAWTLLPLASGMDLITGTPEITAYSIGSYSKEGSNFTQAVKELIDRSLAFVGLLAIYRGFALMYNIGHGKSQHGFGRVAGYFIFGLACFSMDFINAVVASILGFNLFGFLLGTN